MSGEPDLVAREPQRAAVTTRPFAGPDRFEELAFADAPQGTRGDHGRVAGAARQARDRTTSSFIADPLARTLVRAEVMAAICERFPPGRAHAG